MRTKRFWVNRFNEFINDTLRYEVNKNEEFARLVQEEYRDHLTHFQSCINDPGFNLKKMVLLLHVNHEFNLLDPIGVYPQVTDEYLIYAKNIVENLPIDENTETVQKHVYAEITAMWKAMCVRPQKKNQANENCLRVINQLYTDLVTEKQRLVDSFSEQNFWVKRFYLFLSSLHKERRTYQYNAILFQEEMDHLDAEKENIFKEYENNPADYIFFLYLNHGLNLLDPTTRLYPSLAYPFADAAWEIVKRCKTGSEKKQFINAFEGTAADLYKKWGYDAEQNKGRIAQIANTVHDILIQIK